MLSTNIFYFICNSCNGIRTVKKLIELFSNLAAGIYTPDTLDELGHYLESHIRKEERQFFPFIESNCPESALNALL